MATIEEIRNLAEPLKGYQFKVTIANAPGGAGASVEELQFLCQSTVLPGRTVDQVVTSLGGHDVSDPGRSPGPKTWAVTFAETTTAAIVQRVEAWQRLCYDPESGVNGSRADIKRNARIELLNNAKEVVLSRQIVGIWPQDIADMAMDYSSSEVVTLDVTWSYDYHIDI
jgi:hypothetical protein